MLKLKLTKWDVRPGDLLTTQTKFPIVTLWSSSMAFDLSMIAEVYNNDLMLCIDSNDEKYVYVLTAHGLGWVNYEEIEIVNNDSR